MRASNESFRALKKFDNIFSLPVLNTTANPLKELHEELHEVGRKMP
jgi:hypothetical protein